MSLLSNGNRGRAVSILVKDSAAGDERIVEGRPLWAIDYDPVGKGNDLVVSTGGSTVEATHTIMAPTEIWELQDDSGEVPAIEVVDQNAIKTIITFES